MESQLCEQILHKFESAFDRQDDQYFEKFLQFESTHEIQILIKQIQSFRLNRWDEVYQICFDGFLDASIGFVAKGFLLQFAVSASENEFNLVMRDRLVRLWDQIPFLTGPWLCYLRVYHQALTLYYQGSLQESRSRFQAALTMADSFRYPRGRMRSLMHLGIIDIELQLQISAKNNLEDSLAMAKDAGAIKMERRIEKLIQSLGSVIWTRFETHIELLLQEKYSEARSKILEVCRLRRREGRSWFAQSEYVDLALYVHAKKKSKSFASLLKRAEDPLVRIQCFLACKQIGALELNHEAELQWLIESRRLALPTLQEFEAGFEIFGVRLERSKDQEVISLFKLLESRPDGVEKELLAQELWNYNYDPVMHDQRIYKLILKARKRIGVKDVIVNSGTRYYLRRSS